MGSRRAFLKGLGAALLAVNVWLFPRPQEELGVEYREDDVVVTGWDGQTMTVWTNGKIITIQDEQVVSVTDNPFRGRQLPFQVVGWPDA